MTEHEHEPIAGLDKIIRCRICGQMLSNTEQIVSKVTSLSSARKVLDEIAVAGGYRATGFDRGFIIYSKDRDDRLREEICIGKLKEREFVIKKITRYIE